MRSSTVVRCAWPRWSDPVTFGGGWISVNGGRLQSAVDPAPSGAKTSAASHRSYTSCSNSDGTYAFASISGCCGWLIVSLQALRSGPRRGARNTTIPVVQRTNGVVVPPAGSAPGAGTLIAAAWSGALVGALSGASRPARGRRSVPSYPRGLHHPALARGPPRTYSSRSPP